MSADGYFILSIVSYILAGLLLVTTAILFFKLNIPAVIRDKGGSLEQKQIEEIRAKSMGAAQHRGKVNVFEELEKRAKPRSSDTSSLKVGTTGESALGFGTVRPRKVETVAETGTTLLPQAAKAANPDFVIEKNIVFVSTSEVI
jgi:hypothetical protein